MDVLIRTDSSKIVGSGHVMRCLALADMLTDEGHHVSFLCRDLPGNCYEQIQSRKYACNLLSFSEKDKLRYLQYPPGDQYERWLGVSQSQDAKDTINYLLNKPADVIITDNYGLDIKWEEQVKPYVMKLMVIDDLANREHKCDILLDHNYYININNRYDHLVPKNCKKLLGPQYALLNSKIKEARSDRKKEKKIRSLNDIHNILVFLGGMDLENYTDNIVKKLLDSNFSGCDIHVVLGKTNPHRDRIVKKYLDHTSINFHIQPDYYSELLVQADLSINAGGVSALERLYLNIPSFIFCLSENQKQICNDLHESRLAFYIKDMNDFENLLKNSLPVISKLQSSEMLFDKNSLNFTKGLFNEQ